MARKYDSEETKQKILSSSVRLFIEKGYHETTMTEILHDAGVSGSSFHSCLLYTSQYPSVLREALLP